MGNKIWLTGAVRSTKYNRIVEVYPNTVTLGKFQAGKSSTIPSASAEFQHAFYATETDSSDCSIAGTVGALLEYSTNNVLSSPVKFTIKIGTDVLLETLENSTTITPIEITADTSVYCEIKNFEAYTGGSAFFNIVVDNVTDSVNVVTHEYPVRDTTFTIISNVFTAEAGKTYQITLETYTER